MGFTVSLALSVIKDAAESTFLITGMVFLILVAAQVFGLTFRGLGGEEMIHAMFEWTPGGTTGTVLFLLLIFFVLGFFLEWIEITYVVLPLFLPIIESTGVLIA